ncbi:MAG: M23 family metallopeptidase [Acidobacteriota bacterium]
MRNTPDLIFTRASITLEYRSQAQKSLEGSLLESRRNESGKIKLILLLFIVGIAAFFLWREISAAPPEVRLGREIKGISRSTELSFTATDRRSLLALSFSIAQGGETIPILSESYGSRWRFWEPGPKELTRQVRLGVAHQEQLQDGAAELRIEVQNKNWFSSRATLTHDVVVRSVPPRIDILSGLLYVNQAGSEMVRYRVSRYTVFSGVRVGEHFFPGYPAPGGNRDERLALFAFPYGVPADTVPQVMARDDAENESQASFPFRLLTKNFRSRDLQISDSFLQATVPSILSNAPELADQGDLLQNYLMVNGQLRESNRAKIAELSKQSAAEFLWQGSFLQLMNSAVESQFADARTYWHQGKQVDQQVHLGFDLAAVRNTPVEASNAGRVVFAEYLGIFGNTIILDHGFGLQSLYAHLHSFDVGVGDMVHRGQTIGKTGSTGLAGGDHLHFTMLLAGVEVNPIEWWDQRWIEQHILPKLSAAEQTTREF